MPLGMGHAELLGWGNLCQCPSRWVLLNFHMRKGTGKNCRAPMKPDCPLRHMNHGLGPQQNQGLPTTSSSGSTWQYHVQSPLAQTALIGVILQRDPAIPWYQADFYFTASPRKMCYNFALLSHKSCVLCSTQMLFVASLDSHLMPLSLI